MKLTHVSESGSSRMVDVSAKEISHREAVASGRIRLQPRTVELIKKQMIKKGDVLAVARVAAINSAKTTSYLIPLCHNIPLDHVEIEFSIKDDHIDISSRTVCTGKTGVEMEALTAVSIAALTIYDMCKAVDKTMIIGNIRLEGKQKHGIHD